ncbi:MAG: FlgN family protein [Acidimicrobiales bacterium]|nr:FlgN family protein [Acidimicrobiales bacterium]
MVLQHEEALLELLLFKLVETRLLLEADEVRFLARATREVERARRRTREADLLRAASVDQLEVVDGEPSDPSTLRSIAAACDEPWASIHRDHHDLLCSLVSEIEVVAHRNACLAKAAVEQLSAEDAPALSLAGVSSATSGVARQRLRATDPTLARLAEGAAYDGVLGAAANLRMPSLLAFLR